MKKALSLFLLMIFLFNLGGYYLLFWALKAQANQELSVKLDEGNYDQDETIEIRIPLTLPYPLQSKGYERQTGQFVYNREQYQLVKQKYENDTLTIVCVKDVQNKHLANVMDSFSESAINQPIKDGTLNLPTKILQEYISILSTSLNGINGWSRNIHYTPYLINLSLVTLTKHSPPPWA